MARLCPDCQQPLQSETYHGVHLDTCPQCAGFWFDEAELGRVRRTDPLALIELEEEHLPQVQTHPDANTTRRCPDCQSLLDRYQYLYDSPVTLDICVNCEGVWVEDSELGKIAQWLSKGKHPVTSHEQQQARTERALAEAIVEHEQTMGNWSGLRGLCSLLSQRRVW
jgi:Zn-finger nucleic acid-binding protein